MIFGPQSICYHRNLICIKHLISVRMYESLSSGWEPAKTPDLDQQDTVSLPQSNLESGRDEEITESAITSPGYS